jgi:hypothetical protein
VLSFACHCYIRVWHSSANIFAFVCHCCIYMAIVCQYMTSGYTYIDHSRIKKHSRTTTHRHHDDHRLDRSDHRIDHHLDQLLLLLLTNHRLACHHLNLARRSQPPRCAARGPTPTPPPTPPLNQSPTPTPPHTPIYTSYHVLAPGGYTPPGCHLSSWGPFATPPPALCATHIHT